MISHFNRAAVVM